MVGKLKKLAGVLGASPKNGRFAPEALAVAALMVEAAAMDGAFDDAERAAVCRLLCAAFDLDDAGATALLVEAEAAHQGSNQLLHFTRTVKDNVPFEERVAIMEMLWEVVLADGEVHDYEANLMRRVAGLIHVTDRESGAARKRAEQKFPLARHGQDPLED